MLIFIFGLLAMTEVSARGEWWTTPRTEDETHIYYVGVSEGKEGLSKLQDKAFNKALGELIREHFGMSIQVSESAVEELQRESFQVTTKQSSAPLYMKGLSLSRTFEKETEHGIRVFVQLRIEKEALTEAKELHLNNPGEDSLNTYGEAHVSKVEFKIKTHPQNALIHFTHLDQRYSLQGQGDAIFYLPRGRYQMVVSAPGHSTLSKEILVQSHGLEDKVILEELYSKFTLSIFPPYAKVELNGKEVESGEFRLPVARTHRIKVSHPDFLASEMEFHSQYPETVKRTISLKPRDSSLYYDVSPKAASIKINGEEARSFNGKIPVKPGMIKVRISHAGYESYEESLFVPPNRDMPLKVVYLKREEPKKWQAPTFDFSKWDFTPTVRLEYNPLVSYDAVAYFMIAPIGFHIQWKYLSIGYGHNHTQHDNRIQGNEEDNSSGNRQTTYEKRIRDNYAQVRLISPSMGKVKIYASGVYGRYTISKLDELENMQDEFKKNYQGIGGGFRYAITDHLSIHGEYHKLTVKDVNKDLREKKDRFVLGLGYDF